MLGFFFCVQSNRLGRPTTTPLHCDWILPRNRMCPIERIEMRTNWYCLLLILFALPLTPATAQGETEPGAIAKWKQQAYVCVKRWGIRRNEGYCGVVTAQTRAFVSIKVLWRNRTVWRTRGNQCSAGVNLKDLLPGVVLRVPKSCL